MNINEIMAREIAEEDRRQARTAAKAEAAKAMDCDFCELPWVRLTMLLALLLAMLGTAFWAGAAWQASEIRQRDDAFNRFLLEGMRSAAADAAAKTNAEVLRDEKRLEAGRGCAVAD